MASSGFSGAASAGQLEEKVDLSDETNAKIAQAQQLVTAVDASSARAVVAALQEALALLMALEKKCRIQNDNASLKRVCETCIELCHQQHVRLEQSNSSSSSSNAAFEVLVSTLKTLSTRRSQKTVAQKALVQTAMPWCIQKDALYTPIAVPTTGSSDQTQAKANRDQLVQTLLEITEGKIFLERERAQFTRALATIKEEQGDIPGAAEILQDVHVETFGSLSKKEKIEFILEQLRFTLAKQDYVRAQIVAGKINRKQFYDAESSDADMATYKIKFFQLLSICHRHEANALELAKDYHAIYSTPSSSTTTTSSKKTDDKTTKQKEGEHEEMETEDTTATTTTTTTIQTDKSRLAAFQATIVFLALSPYSNEQQDMMYRIQKQFEETNKNIILKQVPACFKTVIDLFLKKEIISYPMPQQKQVLEQIPELEQDNSYLIGSSGIPLPTTVSKTDDATTTTTSRAHWQSMFHRRIIQHNIRVVAGYYKQIRLDRFTQLLQLPNNDETEREIAHMVSDGVLYAKMNRPKRIVQFVPPQSPEQVLSAWAADIEKVLHLVETTSHLINKENMTAQ